MSLGASDFRGFFEALHGHGPFPWQERLARRVCEEGWPAAIDLPTASGKTACIDIAVFAMAVSGTGPRRVFFVVDRRIVVDAAFDRMKKIAARLKEASDGILRTAADSLRAMAGTGLPLDTFQLRGGIYRDDSWVRTPLQPMLVASTVDQVGSRLLFRGYGVWDKVLPIHAALVANDALIILDEAHCSRAFAQTLDAVRRYRGPEWTRSDLGSPFAFVEMTATPVTPAQDTYRLDSEDYADAVLSRRLFAPKAVALSQSKARAKDFGKLASDLVAEARRLAREPGIRRVAIIVNRVRTAKLAYQLLRNDGAKAHLLIGRMRPIDRIALPADLTGMISGSGRTPDGDPVFVVATQCLEVGADFDFDAIVTECASMDALLQRFGRLDRVGDLYQSGTTARGSIVISTPMADTKYVDPIYANTLSRTWQWLNAIGGELNFGICSPEANATVREKFAGYEKSSELRREGLSAPILLPAHLDSLVQTSPRPALEPDVALFLHGKEKGTAEVQVVWRADLDPGDPGQWAEVVSMCPPVSLEAMTVPLHELRTWLSGSETAGLGADVEGSADEERESEPVESLRCSALLWRGDQSKLLTEPEDLNLVRPRDTVVLSQNSGGWNELGHIPDDARIDVAERARHDLRRGWILRLHPSLIPEAADSDTRDRIRLFLRNPDPYEVEMAEVAEQFAEWLQVPPSESRRNYLPNEYPSASGQQVGWVLSARFSEPDAGGDESSSGSQVDLEKHLADVTAAVTAIASALADRPNVRDSLIGAARLHDYGKADARFQALLHGGDPMAARFAPKLLAKGTQARSSRAVRKQQWMRSGLPADFRHELVSLLLAMQHPELRENALALHLIGSHHGRCRPFSPVVDDTGPGLSYGGLSITSSQRVDLAAHRIDSGVADRFWELNRLYGWWGLAYLETLLRLGDWEASRKEEEQ